MTEKFETVSRRSMKHKRTGLTEALLKTVDSGKAIVLNSQIQRNAVYSAASRHGLKGTVVSLENGKLVAWLSRD